MDNNSDIILAKINKTEIAGSISTELGCSLKYVFEISVTESAGFRFEFSLPQNAVISGFAVEDGKKRYESAIPADPRTGSADGGGYTMRLGTDGMFVFTSEIPPAAESFTLEVRAVVLFEAGKDFLRLSIPLETKPERTVYADTVRENTLISGCAVSINFMITEKSLCSVTSPTHEIAAAFAGDALEVCADTVSAGTFEMDLFRRGSFENTAYLLEGRRDGTGVYLFSAGARTAEKHGILYILDADEYKNSLGMITAECLSEMLSHTDTGFMLADIDGNVFSDKLIYKTSVSEPELTRWLYSSRSGTAELGSVIRDFTSCCADGEIVLVTCSGRSSYSLAKCGLPINILSISESMVEYGLSAMAEESGGIYARLHRGADHAAFARAFTERVESGYLHNVKIINYANGTYFKIPSVIGCHRAVDIITYTFRTNGEFPEQLFVSADGGYSEKIGFGRVSRSEDGEAINSVFAAKALSELYGYIARGDVAPQSVRELKRRAVELSREFGVLCPDTSFELRGPDGVRACAAKFALRLERPASFSGTVEAATVSDYSIMPEAEREATARGLIYRLLACMLPDGTYYSMHADGKTAAAYAAAAIRTALRCGFLRDAEEYLKIACEAEEIAGYRAELSTDGIVSDCDMLDAVDISKRILMLSGGK